jgi:hypothetical protein
MEILYMYILPKKVTRQGLINYNTKAKCRHPKANHHLPNFFNRLLMEPQSGLRLLMPRPVILQPHPNILNVFAQPFATFRRFAGGEFQPSREVCLNAAQSLGEGRRRRLNLLSYGVQISVRRRLLLCLSVGDGGDVCRLAVKEHLVVSAHLFEAFLQLAKPGTQRGFSRTNQVSKLLLLIYGKPTLKIHLQYYCASYRM